MTTHRLINWTLAALIAAIMSTSYLLDGPDDHHAEQAHAMSLRDAQRAQAAQFRKLKAASAMCGNGAVRESEDGAIHCLVRHAKRVSSTQVAAAQVQP